jgi:hypothetical protein
LHALKSNSGSSERKQEKESREVRKPAINAQIQQHQKPVFDEDF